MGSAPSTPHMGALPSLHSKLDFCFWSFWGNILLLAQHDISKYSCIKNIWKEEAGWKIHQTFFYFAPVFSSAVCMRSAGVITKENLGHCFVLFGHGMLTNAVNAGKWLNIKIWFHLYIPYPAPHPWIRTNNLYCPLSIYLSARYLPWTQEGVMNKLSWY